ncbi:MAG TPA: response regulator [Polyangiaceae bacterium]|nr:response regulator [Polyangiaceae bacterium]
MSGRPYIVHVDDDPDDRRLARRHLERAFPGAAIVEVGGGAALAAELERGDFDVLVTDFKLGWSDGLRVLRAVKGRRPDAPVVMFTNTGTEEIAVEAMKSGLDDYVIKSPRHYARLPLAVRGALERAEGRRERAGLLERERRARREAEEANRAKDEFLLNVSHELRTPLHAIAGWAHSLCAGRLSPAQARDACERLLRNARVLARLVDDLLDVGSALGGRLGLERAPVPLGEIVREAAEALRLPAEAKGIAVEVRETAPRAVVLGDRARLTQIAWNLLHNAIKFTPPGGHVVASVEPAPDAARLRLVVRDDGVGIAPEFLPHVFERFRQAEAVSSTRHYKGLGLGLSIVRHLVELHGGAVEARSEGPGKGTTVVAELPPYAGPAPEGEGGPAGGGAAAAGGAPGAGDAGAGGLRGVRVLAVDDDEDARLLLEAMLECEGAEVRTASSGREALATIAAWGPHVLVCDIGLEGENGYALLGRVRREAGERGRTLPAIALTGYAREADRRRALDAGFARHVSKPVDPDALIGLVRELAGRGPGPA